MPTVVRGSIIEVDSNNYNTEVVQRSYEKPVLLDFFATWCGPCQVLKPLLEKLLQEYDFVLAKINIDQNQDLANQFGVEGVPDVRIVSQGEMFPGFVGVLPEPQLRELLTRLNLKSALDLKLEEIQEAIAAENWQQAKQGFDQLFTQYPENPRLAIEAAKFLLQTNQLEDAQKILTTVAVESSAYHQQAKSVQGLIHLKQQSNDLGDSELERKFVQGAQLTLQQKYEKALPLFLEIVEENRKFKKDGARKAMVTIFEILGTEHPLTREYQQKLMLTLY